jgi:hypothetical protein
MKTMILTTTLLAAGLLAIAACDRADTGSGTVSQTPPISFEKADANGDGRITTQEALAVPGLDFARLDADGNQSVTPQEFATAMALAHPRG